MARYTAGQQGYQVEDKRRKRQALQAAGQQRMSDPGQQVDRGRGFVAPQAVGVSANQQAGRPQFSGSDFARFAAAGKGMGLSNQQMQGMLNQRYGQAAPSGYNQPMQRRYGQQQGYGGGYVPPRQAIGGYQQPYGMQRQNPNYMGYSPQTAGMYGGRPSYGGYGQGYGGGYPVNQQQAMMRPQYSYGAQTQQPWGGYQAVPRYNNYQQYGGWY